MTPSVRTSDPVKDAKRKAVEKAEWQDHVIQSAIAETPELGPGSTGKPQARIVTTDAQGADVLPFRVERRPSLSPTLRVDPDSRLVQEKRYTKAEYDALMRGYYCRNCDDLQREVIPLSSAVVVPAWDAAVCVTVSGNGCGFPRSGRFRPAWEISRIGSF